MMRYSNLAENGVSADEALHKPDLSSLRDGRHVLIHALSTLSEEIRRVIPRMNWQASGVERPSDIHALFEATHNTPPPRESYTCSNIEARVVRKRRQKTLSPLTIPRFPLVSPSKKIPACSSQYIAAYYDKGNETSRGLCSWVTAYHHDQMRLVCWIGTSVYIDSFLLEYVPMLPTFGHVNVRTSCYTADMQSKTGSRKSMSPLIFEPLNKPYFEEDQKKKKKRPKRVKPTSPKIKKQKYEREDDKEKQDENDPRTEGPVL